MESRDVEQGQTQKGSESETPRHRRNLSVSSMISIGSQNSPQSIGSNLRRSPTTRRSQISEPGPSQGHGRTQSLGGPVSSPRPEESRVINTRRREKAAVGFACLNCKKAHLACDVTRPCRRCVQIGRSSTCSDVPHKRRGRPRLIDSARQSSSTEPLSPVGLAAGSPTRSNSRGSPFGRRRGHARTGSMNSPYMDFGSLSPQNLYAANPPRSIGLSIMQNIQSVPIQARSPLTPGGSLPFIAWNSPPQEDQFRPMSATLFISLDLQIVRALPDTQDMFCVASFAIEGRTLAELCTRGSSNIMPVLIQALRNDVQLNKLLFSVHEYRHSLFDDLRPYSNSDLFHPFPGAQEHLYSVVFIDSYNRQIPSRMVAVLGSRSNDRFAYAIISIQRQDLPFGQVRHTGPLASPLCYNQGGFAAPPEIDTRTRLPPEQQQYQRPISPIPGQLPHSVIRSPGQAVPRTVMPPFLMSPRARGVPSVNTLAPMINTRITEEAGEEEQQEQAVVSPTDPASDNEGSRRSSGKRISMCLSEMIE